MGNQVLTFATDTLYIERWRVPSKLLVSLLEERLLGSSWPPRLQGSPHLLLEVSRNLIVTDLELWLSERSEDTRSLQNSSSASFHSNVWSVRLPRISRPT